MGRTLTMTGVAALCALIGIAAGGCAKRTVSAGGLAKTTPVAEAPRDRGTAGGRATDSARGIVERSLGAGEKAEDRLARVQEPPPTNTGALQRAPESPLDTRIGGAALQTIYFGYDEYALSPNARDIVASNARLLAARPGVRLRIEGHCDERGTTEYNISLGERRARSAFEYLADLGVDPNRMTVVSFGEERPADRGHGEQAWAKNRRVEFVEQVE